MIGLGEQERLFAKSFVGSGTYTQIFATDSTALLLSIVVPALASGDVTVTVHPWLENQFEGAATITIGPITVASSVPTVVSIASITQNCVIKVVYTGNCTVHAHAKGIHSKTELPDGAATAANQATTNTKLDTISGKLPSQVNSRVPVQPDAANRTPTTTSVASSATSVTILAANTNRRGFMCSNQSTSNLYLSFSTPATVANSFILMPTNSFMLFDHNLIFTGAIYGLWSAAQGTAQITELV